MSANRERVIEDLMRVLSDIDELVKGAVASGNGEAGQARGLQTTLANARAKVQELKQSMAGDVRRRVSAADEYIHQNTWKTVGAAATIAFIAGLLMGRPRQP